MGKFVFGSLQKNYHGMYTRRKKYYVWRSWISRVSDWSSSDDGFYTYSCNNAAVLLKNITTAFNSNFKGYAFRTSGYLKLISQARCII